ncbi:MAG: hypothetical protein QNL87_08950 [Gammaproteobacteria bacterium]|nr:hypothetical protein [Gammaproteobacteria bacterium]
MDRNSTRPLTPDAAKARLRSVAESMGPVTWIKEKPRESISMALIAGLLAGKTSKSNEVLANTLVSLLLKMPR